MSTEYWRLLAKTIWQIATIQQIAQDVPVSMGEITWGRATDAWSDILRQVCGNSDLLSSLHERIRKHFDDSNAFTPFDAAKPTACSDAPSGGPPAWYVSSNAYDARFVGPAAERPMIDLEHLRSALSDLVSGFPVLLVSGDPGSGRSHSWFLIEHVGRVTRAFRTVNIDIEQQWGANDCRPDDLICAIADMLGLESKFEVDEGSPPETRAKLFVNKLRGRLPEDTTIRCVVIDGIDKPNVLSETKLLIEELVMRASVNGLPGLRLVATGTDKVFSRLDGPGIRTTRLEPITPYDLEQFFAVTADHLAKNLDGTESLSMAEKVIAQVGPDAALGVLASAAAELTRKLLTSL